MKNMAWARTESAYHANGVVHSMLCFVEKSIFTHKKSDFSFAVDLNCDSLFSLFPEFFFFWKRELFRSDFIRMEKCNRSNVLIRRSSIALIVWVLYINELITHIYYLLGGVEQRTRSNLEQCVETNAKSIWTETCSASYSHLIDKSYKEIIERRTTIIRSVEISVNFSTVSQMRNGAHRAPRQRWSFRWITINWWIRPRVWHECVE